MDSVDWIEAATVQPGMQQHSMSGPREIASISDSADPHRVTLHYTDGTQMTWNRHEDLPIIPEGGRGITRPVSAECQAGRCGNCWDDNCGCSACRHPGP